MAQVEHLGDIILSPKVIEIDLQTNLDVFLQMHSDKIYLLKSDISKAQKPQELYNALHALYSWQMALIRKLHTYLPDQQDFQDETIKQSDPIDSYQVAQFIRANDIPENQIKTYICNQLKADPVQFSVLTKVCLQAGKINSNVGSRESS